MAGSRVAFAGLSEARATVARLAEALQRAASGEVIERAAVKVAERVQRIALPKVEAHSASGHALDVFEVTISGSVVTLSAPAYLRFHSFWSAFRRGMPKAVLTYAAQVLAAELLAVLGDSDSAGRALAQDVADEQAAGVAKKAANAQAAKQRAEDRKLDRATKKREAAE